MTMQIKPGSLVVYGFRDDGHGSIFNEYGVKVALVDYEAGIVTPIYPLESEFGGAPAFTIPEDGFGGGWQSGETVNLSMDMATGDKMKLWKLSPSQDAWGDEYDPWNVARDRCDAMIVRACSESAARKIAHDNGMDENCPQVNRGFCSDATESPWLDEKYSVCQQLSLLGGPGVIMMDKDQYH